MRIIECTCVVHADGSITVPRSCPQHGVLVADVPGMRSMYDGECLNANSINFASIVEFQKEWKKYRPEPQGTYACPICGCETPHAHSKEQVVEWRAESRQP